jgi:hypothetical protein
MSMEFLDSIESLVLFGRAVVGATWNISFEMPFIAV